MEQLETKYIKEIKHKKTIVNLIKLYLALYAGIIIYQLIATYDRKTFVLSLISTIIKIIPFILILVYISFFHDYGKGTILVSLGYGVMALFYLYNGIYNLIALEIPPKSGTYDVSYLIINPLLFVIFGLATISTLKGMRKKVLLVIAPIFALIFSIYPNIVTLVSVDYKSNPHVEIYFYILASIVGFAALLTFGLKNTIPRIIGRDKSEKYDYLDMDLQNAMVFLRQKHDDGKITNEEYVSMLHEIVKDFL